jgi:predicted RNA-binding protein YlqC (UPF0109 family)
MQDQNRGDPNEGDVMEVRVLFHHSQVGSIIGKGGSKIKELREVSFIMIIITLNEVCRL